MSAFGITTSQKSYENGGSAIIENATAKVIGQTSFLLLSAPTFPLNFKLLNPAFLGIPFCISMV
jgi:hypothetical protein